MFASVGVLLYRYNSAVSWKRKEIFLFHQNHLLESVHAFFLNILVAVLCESLFLQMYKLSLKSDMDLRRCIFLKQAFL